MGPLWIDLHGFELDAEEKELLAHPSVGGVILFSRNYHDSSQLLALNQSIRKVAKGPILIGVDQEGGRVQRFRDGFTAIPPAKAYAFVENGEVVAKDSAWLMASELIAHEIDLSFAPVLDCGFNSKAIGNRAFGEDKQSVLRFSSAFISGMRSAGMATTGKHFPGHGAVHADSHLESPIDDRTNIIEEDMDIFQQQILSGSLDAIMPAHVIYPHYDDQPASGSSYWLKDVLRKKLGFKGIIFSDDLNMLGAHVMGSASERCLQALKAGCDMLLLCNNRSDLIQALDNMPIVKVENAHKLLKKKSFDLSQLKSSIQWKDIQKTISACNEQWLEIEQKK